MSKKAPYECVEVDDATKEERKKLWTGEKSVMVDVVKTKPFGCLLGKKLVQMADPIYNFEVKPDDIWMVTYPKAGSTWLQEMVWQIANGFDVEGGKENIFFRAPFFEMSVFVPDGAGGAVPSMDAKDPASKMAQLNADSVQFSAGLTGQRIIKTHLPLSMLPPNLLDTAKVIFCTRNPKDSAVSFFHHEKMLPPHGLDKDADFIKYTKLYREGNTPYGDYFEHFRDCAKNLDHPNLKHIWFEELKADQKAVMKELAKFLGKDFPDDKLDALDEHLKFDKLKNNDAVNHKPPKGAVPDEVREKFTFFRKGIVGDWKNWFTDEAELKDFEEWIKKGSDGLKGWKSFE